MMTTYSPKLKIASHDEIDTFHHDETFPVAISDATTGDFLFIAHYEDGAAADQAAELFAAALKGSKAITAKPII